MTQPPSAEPPGSPDDDSTPGQVPSFVPPSPPTGAGPGWPAGPPPYGAPAGPQNPYGGGTTDIYRAMDSGGMSTTLKVVLGVVIGLVGGFVLWLVVTFALLAAVSTSSSGDGTFFVLSAFVPLLVPAPLLIWKATRPWAVGIIMGAAVVSIGLAGLCSSILYDVNGGAV